MILSRTFEDDEVHENVAEQYDEPTRNTRNVSSIDVTDIVEESIQDALETPKCTCWCRVGWC